MNMDRRINQTSITTEEERGSVAETSYPSEDNITALTPSVRTAREIASDFLPAKTACGTQIKRGSMDFFSQKKIEYRNKVSVLEVHYSTNDVLVPEK